MRLIDATSAAWKDAEEIAQDVMLELWRRRESAQAERSGSRASAVPGVFIAGVVVAVVLLFVLTWMASIMLGWHYALDGEVAVVAVVFCWVVAGLLTTSTRKAPPIVWQWRRPDLTLEPVPVRSQPVATDGLRSSWTLWPR